MVCRLPVVNYLLRADHARAVAELDTGRHERLIAALRAGLPLDLVEQVLEHDPVTLEADGIDVGQIVRDGLAASHPAPARRSC